MTPFGGCEVPEKFDNLLMESTVYKNVHIKVFREPPRLDIGPSTVTLL